MNQNTDLNFSEAYYRDLRKGVPNVQPYNSWSLEKFPARFDRRLEFEERIQTQFVGVADGWHKHHDRIAPALAAHRDDMARLRRLRDRDDHDAHMGRATVTRSDLMKLMKAVSKAIATKKRRKETGHTGEYFTERLDSVTMIVAQTNAYRSKGFITVEVQTINEDGHLTTVYARTRIEARVERPFTARVNAETLRALVDVSGKLLVLEYRHLVNALGVRDGNSYSRLTMFNFD